MVLAFSEMLFIYYCWALGYLSKKWVLWNATYSSVFFPVSYHLTIVNISIDSYQWIKERKNEIPEKRPGEAGRGRERPGEAGRGREWPGEAGRGRERPGVAGRGRERPGEAGRGPNLRKLTCKGPRLQIWILCLISPSQTVIMYFQQNKFVSSAWWCGFFFLGVSQVIDIFR